MPDLFRVPDRGRGRTVPCPSMGAAFPRNLRGTAGLTRRELGKKLGKPRSWIYNCETGNRRVDMTGFTAWASAWGKGPKVAFGAFRDAAGAAQTVKRTGTKTRS